MEIDVVCNHDYEFIAEGEYTGSRPGYLYDEFYCRHCLSRVAVNRETGQKVANPDPLWFNRTRSRACWQESLLAKYEQRCWPIYSEL